MAINFDRVTTDGSLRHTTDGGQRIIDAAGVPYTVTTQIFGRYLEAQALANQGNPAPHGLLPPLVET